MVLQLSILGYILVPIFTANSAWVTAAYLAFMLLVAGLEALSRPALTYDGMLWQVLASLGLPCSAMLAYGLGAVIRPRPWYDAQYAIPVAGMLLGNACSGVAIGLTSLLDDLSTGRDRVEALLAAGATRWEAAEDGVRRAVRMALTPTLNQMNVAGIVSIPGMMTGQILGGADPTTAARYQIALLLFIAAASGAGAVAAVFLAAGTLLDGAHRLRGDRLSPRGTTGKGVLVWLAWQARRAGGGAARAWKAGVGRVRGGPEPGAVPTVVVHRGGEVHDGLDESLLRGR